MLGFSSVRLPSSDRWRGRRLAGWLVGVAVIAGTTGAGINSEAAAASGSAPAAGGAPASVTQPHRAAAPPVLLAGAFTFHACPAGTPSGDFCLTDVVTGTLPSLGAISGTFEVHIAFSAFGSNGCGPIDKRGGFTSAAGARIQLRASGFYCRTTSIADYTYHASGGPLHDLDRTGLWLVPAPATLTATGGTGPEYLAGSR